MTDLKVTNHGTVVQFFPLSDAGEAFLAGLDAESWSWMGNSLVVDQHRANDLVGLASAEGLVMR